MILILYKIAKIDKPVKYYFFIMAAMNSNDYQYTDRPDIPEHTSGRHERNIGKNVTCYYSDLDIDSLKQPRAGIIPYIIYGGDIIFCLGEDNSYGTLTNFAGGVGDGKNVITEALREFAEESLGIFGPIHLQNHTLVIYNNNDLNIFYQLPKNIDVNKLNSTFRQELFRTDHPEVNRLVWLYTQEFTNAIQNNQPRTYIRLRELLKDKLTNIINKLREIN